MIRRPLLILASTVLLGACGYSESGAGASRDAHTYISTTHQPKTVMLTDTRTGERLFEYELPVGQQLTVRFYTQKEPENAYTPDLMRWQVFDKPSRGGKLNNTLLVPPPTARRLEFVLRDSPEFPPTGG